LTRPNVVVFLTDQQRWDSLGAAGNPLGLTPNLDAMCRTGTMFEVACTTNPVCAPARAALQTGRYPTNAGVHRNGRPLPPDVPTLAREFGAAGYQTGYIGKWHLSGEEPVPKEDRGGYESWLAANLLEFSSDAYHTVVYDEDDEAVFLPGYRSDALVDAAIRFVARASRQDRPFLLFLSLLEPHHQNEQDNYPAPDVYRDTYTSAWLPPDLAALPGTAHQHAGGYYGQIKRVDEGFGRLRDALTSLRLTDSTLVLYTSDHGSHFKTRNDEYKRSPHDGSIRVPLVVDGPGYRGGRRVPAPVSTVDVVPTLLAAAGIAAAEHLDGMPLDRYFDVPADDADGVLVQVSETEVGRALRTSRWKYHVHAPDAGDVPCADSYTERALYDLDADPYELDNLIDSENHRDVAAELGRALVDAIRRVERMEVQVQPWQGATRRLRHPDPTARGGAFPARVLERDAGV
jgi:choline-sulfatase